MRCRGFVSAGVVAFCMVCGLRVALGFCVDVALTFRFGHLFV